MQDNGAEIYQFLLDTYETEIKKIVGIWSAFPDATLDYKPSEKSRSVIEQMEQALRDNRRAFGAVERGIDVNPLAQPERPVPNLLQPGRKIPAARAGQHGIKQAAAEVIVAVDVAGQVVVLGLQSYGGSEHR